MTKVGMKYLLNYTSVLQSTNDVYSQLLQAGNLSTQEPSYLRPVRHQVILQFDTVLDLYTNP